MNLPPERKFRLRLLVAIQPAGGDVTDVLVAQPLPFVSVAVIDLQAPAAEIGIGSRAHAGASDAPAAPW